MHERINEIHLKLLKAKGEDHTRGGSRSSRKGRITSGCPICHIGKMIIQQTDRFNAQVSCDNCGLTENLGYTTISQRGI